MLVSDIWLKAGFLTSTQDILCMQVSYHMHYMFSKGKKSTKNLGNSLLKTKELDGTYHQHLYECLSTFVHKIHKIAKWPPKNNNNKNP